MSKYFNGTGTIGFTCDNCGRELQGCTWVNGMKFCAKCYQETFGNNTSQFVDLLNKEMYELKITDLEAKLAEKEAEIEEFKNREREKIFSLSLYTEFENKLKQANQDKISFAVEQLELLKEKANEKKDWTWGVGVRYKDHWDIVVDIDNQIKQLKEMK